MHIDEEIDFPEGDRNVDCFAYLLNIHERRGHGSLCLCEGNGNSNAVGSEQW